ncbi:MAG: hypothetical protein F6K17_35490, partial [Okeania sp. SIO3C4]|nr:hypothetical protein [Okeania sp. SIO3C4]
DLDPDTKAKETNPELVANKFAASGKIEKGKRLAQEGKIDEAISILKRVQKLSPEIDLDPNTETIETDPQLVANKFFTTGKINEGKNWAQEGNIEKAISLYEQAQKLDSEIDLDPNTETKETDPEAVANKFFASGKVEEGERLAKEGKIDEAISIFKQAQEWLPEIDLDPNTETKETDPELVTNKFAVLRQIEKGKILAKDGKIDEAISIFKRTLELSPEIDLDPDTKAKETDPEIMANKLFATGKIEKGKFLAEEGKIEEAISLYDEAQKLDSDLEITANNWNTLCWYGSLNNQAQDVMFACENAVKLSPDDGNILDSRGVARALTGDYQGAIEDFQVYVDSIGDGEEKEKYQGWIETLKKGKNPFTSEVLEDLKN